MPVGVAVLVAAGAAWWLWPQPAAAPDLPAPGAPPPPVVDPAPPDALAPAASVPATEPGADPGVPATPAQPAAAAAAPGSPPPDPFTREAVRAEIQALLAEQQPDGSWQGADADGAVVGETGTTALGLLALLGAGHVPGEDSPEARAAARALEFLRGRVDAGGRLGGSDFEHNVATLALAEVHGMAPEAGAAPAARAALTHLVQAQAAGRWASNFGDLPVQTYEAVWGVLALVSGRLAELGDHADVRATACEWLEAQQPTRAGPRVAAGAARTFVERGRDHTALVPELERIVAAGPSAADFTTLYFGSLVAFQLGKDVWLRWQPFMAEAVRRAEARAGADRTLSRPMLLLVREIACRYAPASEGGAAGG